MSLKIIKKSYIDACTNFFFFENIDYTNFYKYNNITKFPKFENTE